MKKTRLLASFLSLALGLTSFSAAPVTISAETVETSVTQTTTSAETAETSVTQTTTSAETEGLAPVIHDIDTAREKFEKYIEETNIDANIAEEGKYPQYDGKIVIECEPDTDAYARIFKFADENMILHELFETVIKFDTSKTVNYTVSFRFVDEQTGENIENIHAKLYRYNNKLEPNKDEPGSYFITRDNDVEPVLIAEWNSTETPVFTSETITSYLAQYDYSVITDKLPEGYNFYGKDHVESGYSGAIGNGDHSINIKISKGQPTPATVDIPLEGTFSLDVRVVDQNRNIPLKGMKCEVFEKYSGEVVAEWNTSDTEVMHIEGLEYKFEGNKILEDFGKKIYQFRITNLPENYIYYGYQEDSLTLCGVYIDEFAKGNELSATAYLIDQSPDAPEIKYTTSAVSQVSTTTVTTTTTRDRFEAEKFFVVVGTYGSEGYTQLRYCYPADDGGYTADKVVWKDAPSDLSYGDVFVADGDVSVTKVQAAPNDPVNAFAYYYSLDEGSKLEKAGNCNDIMEKKDLTVTSNSYDGSSHFSIRYKDNDGFTYYYGLSRYGSALTVDPIDCTTGDVYTFALYNGHIVIPLSKKSTAAVTTTTPTTTSVTSTAIDTTKGKGDANCDGNVDMSDAVLIMQSIANPSKYKLTEEGKANADMNGDGVTSGDALAIQKKLLKLE